MLELLKRVEQHLLLHKKHFVSSDADQLLLDVRAEIARLERRKK